MRIEFHAGRGHGQRQDDPWRYSVSLVATIENVDGASRSLGLAIGLFPHPKHRTTTPWFREIEVLWWPR